MPNDLILSMLNPYFIIKVGFIVLAFFYIILSLVIQRRIKIMNECIHQSQVSVVIVLIGWINTLMAVLLFLLSIVIL